MRSIATLISYLFHPAILAYILVVSAYWIDQFGYYFNDSRAVGIMFIMDFFLLILFPVLAIAMLAGLKMISGINMRKREDRIGPLIITLSLYIWFFINVNNNESYPDSLRFVSLGIVLSVGAAFFINNFSKISLHAIGAASLTTGLIILLFALQKSYFDINLILIDEYRLSAIFAIILCLVITGAVGSARLFLKAHTPQEIYGGYVVGFVAQIVAFRIMM